MEESRPLFQQIIRYTVLVGFLLLFTTGILVDGDTANQPSTSNHAITDAETAPPPLLTSKASTESVRSPPDATKSSTPGMSIIPTVHQAASLKATPALSKQEAMPSPTAMNTAVPGDTSTQQKSSTLTLVNVSLSTKEKSHYSEAVVVQEHNTTVGQEKVSTEMTVSPEVGTTFGKKAFPPTKYFGKGTQKPAPSKSPRPREDKRETTTSGPDIPELMQTPDKTLPSPPSVPPINQAPAPGPSATSTLGKNYTAIILAVVFSILLLVSLLVFLYCRHRRHSGSTNFSASGWAGQAALPDDTDLDKDIEPQAGAVGEGETRRGTLVTFFGKRQSRMPSIAMEDINGKEGKEETEQLLHGEAGMGSTSEGSGDANGKVPEPPTEPSQESPASNLSGGSSS